MPKVRIDSWSHEDDVLLKEKVIEHITKGGTQLKAFDEISFELNRTSEAIGYRWNAILRNHYKNEVEEAKKKRLELKRGNKPRNEIKPYDKEEYLQPKVVEEIGVKECNGKRVVTFKDVDEVHGRIPGTARRSFNQNKKHFIEGEDYFERNSYEAKRDFNLVAPNGVNLITESGYLMLVKSFTDDLSWKVQRKLVNDYFKPIETKVTQSHSYMIEDPIERAKRWIEEQEEKKQLETQNLMLEQQVSEYQPKATYVDKILESKDSLLVSQIAEDYGLTAQKMNSILKQQGVQYKRGGQWLLYGDHKGNGYTESQTHTFTKPNGETGSSLLTKWTQKGRLFIHNILENKGIHAIMDKENE